MNRKKQSPASIRRTLQCSRDNSSSLVPLKIGVANLVHFAVELLEMSGQNLVLDVHRLVPDLTNEGEPLAIFKVDLVDLLFFLCVAILLTAEGATGKKYIKKQIMRL